ncbi:hypothetical protein DSO57_1015775 [Entomophthora muscae]|uniref:Uncharacterized protein n=1 Tax=Entomophthora muscae TaxID=34485 RepID=A0ACC2T5G7_9FUNG|nr:hypothetical protein DSO57_1015775 [Entomophthora muscae]
MSQSSEVPEENHNTIYIDTDGSLPCLIPRIQSISNAKGINSEKVLDGIQTFRIFFLAELISLLEKLKNSWMDTHADVKLLIIDSIARPFMNLLNQPESLPSKQYSIYQLNHLLQAISSFGVAVVLVNHLDMVPAQRPQTSYSAPLQVELGDTWSHFANHHLMLLYGRQKKRYALLSKSSQWPSSFAAFEIQEAGLSHESNVGTIYPDFEEETPSTSRQTSDLKDLVSSLTFDQEQTKHFRPSIHQLQSQSDVLADLSQSQDTSEPLYHPPLTQASQSGFPDNFHPPLSSESTLSAQDELESHVCKKGDQSQSQAK